MGFHGHTYICVEYARDAISATMSFLTLSPLEAKGALRGR